MKITKETTKRICFIIAFTAVLVLCIIKTNGIYEFYQKFISIISPIIIGGCIAFVINIPMKGYEKLLRKYVVKNQSKSVRGLSILLAFLSVVVSLVIIAILVIPQIGKSINSLLPKVQQFLYDTQAWFMTQVDNQYVIQILNTIEDNWVLIKDGIINAVKNGAIGILTTIFSFAGSLISTIINLFFSLIFAVYLLFGKERMARRLKKFMQAFLSEKANNRILYVLSLSNNIFSKFISGQCLEALIIGGIFFVFMTIIRLPYALLISVLIAVSALVPIVGAFFGCIVGAFLIFIESPVQMVVFVISFIIIQQIEGNVIYPRVVGDSIGIPAILMLAAITIGGGLWGIAGMLFFIPVSAVIFNIVKAETNRRIEAKDSPSNVADEEQNI